MSKSLSGTRFFIVGFMGVGKTTVGRDLANRLGVPFYDLDGMIEADTGKKIWEIFDSVGEATFRAIETELLQRVVAGEPGIIATGGGTFSRSENQRLIQSSGVSVWLDAPTDLIIERGAGGEHRPLWGKPDKVKALLEKRLPHYRQADIRFDMKSWTSAEAARRLADLLESYCERS